MDRYNPQSIEKQAKKWPALLSKESVKQDLELRLRQVYGLEEIAWSMPKIETGFFDCDYIAEYGLDACRLAVLMSDGNTTPFSLLDSSYKKVSKIYDLLTRKGECRFDEKPWLTALIQAYDHAIVRNKPAQAISLINSALKSSNAMADLTEYRKSLVISALYPFFPLLAAYMARANNIRLSNLTELFSDSEYMNVSFKLARGGWHREIFDRRKFNESPVNEFLSLKWVKKAVGNSKISLNTIDGGYEIVLGK